MPDIHTKDEILKAEHNIHPRERRVVLLADGTRKPFPELNKGDIFALLEPDGTMVKGHDKTGKHMGQWFIATGDVYLNENCIPAIACDVHVPTDRKLKMRQQRIKNEQ